MHLCYDDVNHAFAGMVEIFKAEQYDAGYGMVDFIRVPSRVGDCLMIPEPCTITYRNPLNRVLFNPARDANPFFHLYESLWMLAGRNDIAPLEFYSSTYKSFVDDGDGTANGAYGYRWRHAFNKPPGSRTHGEFEGKDQLNIIIDHLKKVPTSRRAVLQMWNVEDDLLKIGPENQSKDVCCNLSALFSLREDWRTARGVLDYAVNCLDMTVFNRSNDLILGALGANVVHFSFLQEYIANCLGVEVGVYNQISNNMHVYTERFYPDKWLEDDSNYYDLGGFPRTPLVKDKATFDVEVDRFVDDFSQGNHVMPNPYSEPFLEYVAKPMMLAFAYHKWRQYNPALARAQTIGQKDWRAVCYHWLVGREDNYRKKVVKSDE